MDPYLAVFGLS